MNIWAFQSLVAGIFTLCVGIYVLHKGPRELINETFALFAFSCTIWSFSEVGHRIVTNPEAAALWIRAGGFGWCFMFSLYLHFVLVFSRQKKLLNNWFTYVFLYLPSLIILWLFFTTDLIYKQLPKKMYWGYTSLPGDFVWIYIIYYFIIYLLSSWFLIKVMISGSTLRKNQTKPILLGCSITVIIGTLTNAIFPLFNLSIPEIATTFSIIWMICSLYATLKYKLFIEPDIVTETISTGVPVYSLYSGKVYVIKEELLDKSYKIFVDQVFHGKSGLYFTKLNPEKAKRKYKLKHTPFIWLSFKGGENVISPKDILAIETTIGDFTERMKSATIFIDCFNEIREVNGWGKALLFLQKLKNICESNDAIIVLSINPLLFNEEQLSKIKELT